MTGRAPNLDHVKLYMILAIIFSLILTGVMLQKFIYTLREMLQKFSVRKMLLKASLSLREVLSKFGAHVLCATILLAKQLRRFHDN